MRAWGALSRSWRASYVPRHWAMLYQEMPLPQVQETEIDAHPGGGMSEGRDIARKSVKPQPHPLPNSEIAVWDLVIQDMRARDAMGAVKYGTRLQAYNGRDALVDAYQEALDLCVYLRQAIEERKRR